MRTKVISVILCLGVILGLTLLPGAPPKVSSASPADEWGFEIQPSVTTVGFNEDFTVNATLVRYGGEADSWKFYIPFNTSLLEVTDIVEVSPLPTGGDPDPIAGYPKYDNTAGWLQHQNGVGPGDPKVNSTFVSCTIDFRTKAVPGIAYLNFTTIDPPRSSKVLSGGDDVLNWSYVVNGMVMIGMPQLAVLTVDVSPAGMGDVDISGASIPPSYPNTTNWSWDEVVDLEAFPVAGWGFVNWSGDLSETTNPTSITMDSNKSVTANFEELPPAVNEWGFEIKPSVTTVGWDEDFTVNATVVQRGNGNSTAWHMYLLFDPAYLEVTGIDTPSTLPTGDTPDIEEDVPDWNNTAGWAKHGYSRPTGGSEVDTGFGYCTIHFRSKNATGTSYLNFTVVNPANETNILDLHSNDILNWSYVVNGTVTLVPVVSEWGFEIQPSVTGVGVSEDFTVNATVVRYGGEADSWKFYIPFNTSLLEVTNIVEVSPLPTGGDPDPIAGFPKYDNTAGWLQHQSGVEPGDPKVDSTFVSCTITFRTKAVPGIAYLNFTTIDPPRSSKVILLGSDVLNWTRVVNGEVIIGLAKIAVSPTSLSFTTHEGEDPSDKTLKVWNSGVGTLNWSLTDDNDDWLSESPTSGNSTGVGDKTSVTVSVDVTGMSVGDYSATINITAPGAINTPKSVQVSLSIVPPGVEIPGVPGMPGMPEVLVEAAQLSASGLSITPQQVEPGQEVTISISVANTGGKTGSYNAILYINEVVEGSQTVSVAAGTSKNVIFTVTKSQPGVYNVLLAGQSGQFEVVGGGLFGGGLGTGGIIAIVVIVIVLIVALIFILRGTTRPE